MRTLPEIIVCGCLAIAATAGCSAEVDGPAGSDASTGGAFADAAGGGGAVDAAQRADAATADCPPGVPADFGQVVPLDLDQSLFDGVYGVTADLAQDPDLILFTRLREGSGVFAGGVQPGTYLIEGDDTDYQWCSACVYIAVQAPETPWPLLMATGGKITLDTVGATVSGSLAGVTFRQIEIVYGGDSCGDPEQEWPCGNTGCSGGQCGTQIEVGSCETAVASMSF